ncbi:longevity assurance proteins LAG1/LAC1 [Cylindrobasidium torrendii FP15055 ss-10]|uniref:Longevity assurance proteins LAG1/LAC1 n=1 Tax=Cylindrobasidium torrendii FP15055 ss-10 TaxID=1314674 RepID=A0A0D7BUV0_9AGAR|nr:longevity assurance proteins LAG1/LAC1 [Cylindrobasidium torrendii FP15055 ss-10]
MASPTGTRNRRGISVVTGIEENPTHHLAGPLMPQTPFGDEIQSRSVSPAPHKTKPRISPWLRWAIHPYEAFKIVIVPVVLFVLWELLAPDNLNAAVSEYLGPYPDARTAGNPFRIFFLLSNFVPTSKPDDPRYQKGYSDLVFIAYYIFFWSMVRQLITINLCHPLARRYGLRKEAKLDRFGEQGYAMIYFFIMGFWGVRVMSQLPTWWYNVESFWIGYPHWDMIPELKRYYLMHIAYWSQQLLVLLLGLEKPRSDYYELIAHHFVTIWLVGWSYLVNLTLIGNAIYASMDLPDTIFAFSKILNYLQFETSKIITFAITVCVWTYFRHWQNLRILWSVWFDFDLVPEAARVWDPPSGAYLAGWMQYQVFAPILLLQFLNLFWYYLILRVAYRAIKGGASAADDPRSDDEGDGDEDEKEE